MAEEPKTSEPTPAVEQIVAVETDLLGDPVVGEQAPPTGEERLEALEALTQKLLDYGAALQIDEVQARLEALEAKLDRIAESPFNPEELESRLYEMEGRYAALEVKLDRIAASQPRAAYPKTIDELPSPFAAEG